MAIIRGKKGRNYFFCVRKKLPAKKQQIVLSVYIFRSSGWRILRQAKINSKNIWFAQWGSESETAWMARTGGEWRQVKKEAATAKQKEWEGHAYYKLKMRNVVLRNKGVLLISWCLFLCQPFIAILRFFSQFATRADCKGEFVEHAVGRYRFKWVRVKRCQHTEYLPANPCKNYEKKENRLKKNIDRLQKGSGETECERMGQSRVYNIACSEHTYSRCHYHLCNDEKLFLFTAFLRVHETLLWDFFVFFSCLPFLFDTLRFYRLLSGDFFSSLYTDTTLSYRIISIKFCEECSSTLIIILMPY